jgi:two-component system response regulator ChvI
VVLLDWTMPGLSGIDVLQRLRGIGCDKPVVFLTGGSPVEREMKALQHGAVDFIDKGRGVDVLTSRLGALIDRAAGQRVEQNRVIRHGKPSKSSP